MATNKWIGTHDGKFHCDEVFACYMLQTLPEFAGHAVVRTREAETLAKCEVVVDVGGVYDHTKRRYDHHQRGFEQTMKKITGLDYETKLSSAGLVYAHYGREVIRQILEKQKEAKKDGPTQVDVDKLYDRLYKNFVESIDAIDNGIQQFDGPARYQLASTLDSRVSHCNPAWNDNKIGPEQGFQRARQIVGEEFEDRVLYLYNAWLPARKIVQNAIDKRKEVHESGKILTFPPGNCPPWKEHFFSLEKELGLANEGICLAVFQDVSGNWRVQAIPVSGESGFENRIDIPWKGLRDQELQAVTAIPDALFVHISGFIGGAKSYGGALNMAVQTLQCHGLVEK